MRRRRLLLVVIGVLGATLALGTAASPAATRRAAPNYSLRVTVMAMGASPPALSDTVEGVTRSE